MSSALVAAAKSMLWWRSDRRVARSRRCQGSGRASAASLRPSSWMILATAASRHGTAAVPAEPRVARRAMPAAASSSSVCGASAGSSSSTGAGANSLSSLDDAALMSLIEGTSRETIGPTLAEHGFVATSLEVRHRMSLLMQAGKVYPRPDGTFAVSQPDGS